MASTHSKTWLAASAALSVAALIGGCSREDEATPGHDKIASGERLYAEMCKGCHGARGEGGRGPVLRDIYLRRDEASLVSTIDATMPLGESDRCTGKCAEDVGAYVFHSLRGAIVCDAPAPVARGLRLLTRRELRATFRDLLGDTGAAAPTAPCGQHTFTFDATGRSPTTVHVAGTFNNWAGTIAAGGWPLAKGAGSTWSLTRIVPPGSHQYKLVVDQSEWLRDVTNPKTAPDGLGGENSALEVTCTAGGGGGATGLDPLAGFPPDTRPEGFLFDDHGPGRVVTSVLMDEIARAAASLARGADLAKLVTCDRADRAGCGATFVRGFGKRAFRRPLSDAEVQRYTKLVTAAADFDAGARAAIRTLLTSPSFVYRSEVGEPKGNGTFALTPWETASALSYLFWGTMPDGELFDAAERGELASPAGIEKQARRLLASPRARETVATFAEQWLGAENVPELTRNEQLYPFPADLRAAMREETRRFVAHVVFDGSHRLDELFTADYTFANERLAAHYGLSGVKGAELRQVKYDGPMRSGLLGHGSMLAITSHSDQTSPIRRGLFVRQRLLCQEFPPPPPNAGGVPKVDPAATTRERFAQHTSNPFCKSCHQYIDDVGFGFERFDPIGRLRDSEAGKPIDAKGDMNDVEGFGKGTHAPFSDTRELGRVLAASEAAKACVVRQVYRFARGHLDDDVCQVAPIQQRFIEHGGDLRELLVAVTTDPAFVLRK